MDIPKDFIQLCNIFYPGIFDEYSTEEECIADIVLGCSDKRKQVIKKFLDQLLSGRYSDAELARIWLSTNPSYDFSEGGHRIFLTKIRDMIDRERSAGRKRAKTTPAT